MDALRWQRIEEIFHTVVDVPRGAAREATLETLCNGDDELSAAVRGLLVADDGFEAAEETADPHIGLRLGSYAIVELIGRGGMAAVYKAHRADDQFHQQVAIKIMDLRLSDPALVAQFKAERQILAAFEHPTLTRLLDGGVTALGEPYLVMEYVEGQPIDRYCDERRLDLATRVHLFMQVCAGVAFAHRNLVLHRDLKPSNILVTSDGHPKVVDFGTATLLQPDRLATISRAPLTPAYASPEQLTGGAVGTTSDQYSLGLVLYELVTGVSPFAARASLMAAVERALARTEPTAPHDAVTDDAAEPRRTSIVRLRRELAGDLGIVVRKAVAADPAARYASVEHLAEDLERWSRGEAILGRAPSVVYRASRFFRRHRIAVAIAATLLMSLLAATAVSFRQAAIARAESAKARQMNTFLTRMLSSANPSWINANAASAGSITVREVLDGAGQLIPTELGATPDVEADMRRTLGRTYLGLGALSQALPHLDQALALYRQQGDAFGVAFTQMLLGEHRLLTGDFKGAEQILRDAVAYVRSRGGQADPELHLIATNDLGIAIGHQRPGHPEAFGLMRESIAIADRNRLNPGGTAVVVTNLGTELFKAGRIDEAEATLRDALRRMDALPFDPPERVGAHNTMSNVLRTRGEYADAERIGAAAVEGAARVWPADHPFQASVKTTWGRALVAVGQLERGRALLVDAHALYRKSRPAGHTDLAGPLLGLGTASRLEGQLRESERLLREARALVQQNAALTERTADVAGELGLTLRALGDVSEADGLLKESHDLLHAAYGEAHPLTKRALARLRGSEPVTR
jgi:eukaryotic-like serine/threonine-protein kinase